MQQILGHSDPSVTLRYAHLDSRAMQEAANSASRRMKVPVKLKLRGVVLGRPLVRSRRRAGGHSSKAGHGRVLGYKSIRELSIAG